MVDITSKTPIYREASAYGRIRLKPETVRAIVEGRVEKGDVFSVSRVAATLAVKSTPRILPLCHPIPITGVDVKFDVGEDYIGVYVTVRSVGRTGVEMEALTGVSVALLNIWDMVKKLEKDESGNYPWTRIEGIVVLKKVKGGVS